MPQSGIYVTSRVYDALADTVSFTETDAIAADGSRQPVWRLSEPL
jgi:hypothetical protein